MDNGENLTPKQAAFCREYLVDLNGTQAAIRAGYSPKTANEQAAQLLAKLSISSVIQKAMDERAKRVEISADDVLGDILETRKAAAAEGKHSDRLRANELLGKHLKLFTDKVDHQNLDKNGQPADPPTVRVEIVKSGD
jgi:phage terminase small subunit